MPDHGINRVLAALKPVPGLLGDGDDPAVALGAGQIDLVPLLRAAKQAGVKWYFIEDESPVSEKQIPESLRFLEQVQW